MRATSSSLYGWFLDSARRHPGRPAVVVGDDTLSYGALAARAGAIAAALAAHDPVPAHPVAGVFGYRTASAYAGVLGVLGARKGYVPFNPKFPAERTHAMIDASGVRLMVVDRRCAEQAALVLTLVAEEMVVLLPDEAAEPDWAEGLGRHRFIPLAGEEATPPEPAPDPEDIAYLLFTSGSTGAPKGVMVSHANANAYVASLLDLYRPEPEDRFSQYFDLTFDLSVHDMFVCWAAAAALHVVPEQAVMAPARFIAASGVTFWFSVPSTVGFMRKFGMLKPNAFPGLRWSLFCGEALPAEAAQVWQAAAPASMVENLYGPTEATIAITRYRWDSETSPNHCVNGVVPIGRPLPGQHVRVADGEGCPLPAGETGELYLGGDQVSPGYWRDPERTAAQFVRLDDGPGYWYRTGDLVRETAEAGLVYLGRVDSQVKIRGYRVELQEIEHVLRQASGTDLVAVIGWPVTATGVGGTEAFVGRRDVAAADLIRAAEEALPDYMVPRDVHFLDSLPLNANGKIDRGQLVEMRRQMDG